MSDPVTITFTLSEDRYMHGCHQLWAHDGVGRTGNIILGIIFAGIGCFLIWQGALGLWAWCALGVAGGLLVLDALRDRLWRRHYRSLIKYTAPIRATFTAGGIDMQSAEAATHLDWHVFHQHVFTRDFLFLVIDRRQFSVIPLTAFETPAARANAEAMIAKHLKRRKGRLF